MYAVGNMAIKKNLTIFATFICNGSTQNIVKTSQVFQRNQYSENSAVLLGS